MTLDARGINQTTDQEMIIMLAGLIHIHFGYVLVGFVLQMHGVGRWNSICVFANGWYGGFLEGVGKIISKGREREGGRSWGVKQEDWIGILFYAADKWHGLLSCFAWACSLVFANAWLSRGGWVSGQNSPTKPVFWFWGVWRVWTGLRSLEMMWMWQLMNRIWIDL